MTLAKPDLPAHHPQNVPLSEWSDGWLKLSVASHAGASFIMLRDDEKQAQKLPVSRDEMIDFLVSKGDIPAAGVTCDS